MKTESRVRANYKKGTTDWQDQYGMLLEDGLTCSDCRHSKKCSTMFGQNLNSTSCQFAGNKFSPHNKE